MRRGKKVTIQHPRSGYARDAEIGRLVRTQRQQLRMSQSELAEQIGVALQQVKKYEKGKNWIAIGRLTRIAKALDVPPTFFFAGETKGRGASGSKSCKFLAGDGALRLIKAYDRFPSREMRTAFVQLAESIAK